MNPITLANKYFGPWHRKRDEIIPSRCPICGGGPHHDKDTFALNVEKLTYNCKRGKCNPNWSSGTFRKLCEYFGEEADRMESFEIIRPPKRTYQPPKTVAQPAGSKVEAYLMKRGFSKATWERRKVGDDGHGNIIMPYYQGGVLVLNKFRPAHKPVGKERKGWCDEGGKPVLWGIDDADPSLPLVIVEGEMDALSLDEAGVPNAVSVPFGCENLDWIDECWDKLQEFNKVILWGDNDEPGRKMQRTVIQKLGTWRCWQVQCERKDANEVLFFDGKAKVKELVDNAIEVPIAGLIRLADVPAFDYSKIGKCRSGFKRVDRTIGGFAEGQTTVWTGINGSGKSTVLGEVILEAVDEGKMVCAYSGELPAQVYRSWIDSQAAGLNYLEYRYDEFKEEEVAYPRRDVHPFIVNWYRDHFFLFDNLGSADEDNLLRVFEYAARRYNCKVFLVDNLMTTTFTSGDRDFWRAQSNFVGRLVDFSHRFDAHVHVVAHPRKAEGRLTKMDIAGSGDITNRVDNVMSVHRCNDDERGKLGCDAIIEVFKNRYSGKQDVAVKLNFDPKSRRLYQIDDPVGAAKSYGWQKAFLASKKAVKVDDTEGELQPDTCPFA